MIKIAKSLTQAYAKDISLERIKSTVSDFPLGIISRLGDTHVTTTFTCFLSKLTQLFSFNIFYDVTCSMFANSNGLVYIYPPIVEIILLLRLWRCNDQKVIRVSINTRSHVQLRERPQLLDCLVLAVATFARSVRALAALKGVIASFDPLAASIFPLFFLLSLFLVSLHIRASDRLDLPQI